MGRQPVNDLWLAPMPIRDDGSRKIRRLLVANRGEIACRIIATCRKLHITSIAIYANEDSASRHVVDADEALNIGSMDQPGGTPFLNIELLVRIARRHGVDAVHPGYGYLSENACFADAVRAAGIIYVGPPSTAIRTLGDKRQAKEYLGKNEPSVPLIPGFTGSSTGINADDLQKESEKIGFPVMIKAAAGGGGKGLRIVRKSSALKDEFKRAQSEAQRSFGLSDCILEKYIEAGKHVEVQIMGDSHGNVVSLWERDCSVQRRHQKIIEESPCSWLTQDQREAICAVAVKIGQLLKYEGAGTVEFILDVATGSFYFLEVNARLQVEHPITEECTGLDLVSLQLLVASGGDLSSHARLSKIPQNGHAIECRLCAEAPNRQFAPQHGPVRLWQPSTSEGATNTRFETGIETGATISIHFDPMIAKIIVWAPTRAIAIEKMARVLAQTVCLGLVTNQLFLQACLLHPAFRKLSYTTAFIPDHLDDLLRNPYLESLKTPETLLAILPGIFVRKIGSRQPYAKPRAVFGSLRPSFRNHKADKISAPLDIISATSLTSPAENLDHVCLWSFTTRADHSEVSVQMTTVADAVRDIEQDTDQASGKITATRAYNALSRLIRKEGLFNSKKYPVKVHQIRSLSSAAPGDEGSESCVILASIHDQKLEAYLVADRSTGDTEREPGRGLRVLCHFPSLGGPQEFVCHSALSYAESQRLAAANGDEASEGFINAPMPCKVLHFLKKDGDEVEKGDIVLVIESMKMEITLAAGKAGKFLADVSEGEAVAEGCVLCHIN